MIFREIRRWLEDRRIRRMGFTPAEWEDAISDWPVMTRYQGTERDALREMTFRFLVRKTFVSGNGFEFTDAMCLKIATMACVPVLHLGLDWYDRWKTLIIYGDDFIANRPHQSDDGVVHSQGPGLSGEAWYRGPVILSWESVRHTGPHIRHGKASNVVIHELAHKLDMLRDGANGAPLFKKKMHPDLRAKEWHQIFMNAWDRLQNDWRHHRSLPIDDYGLTAPAEFFAVCSETFFEAPEVMRDQMPEVYRLLCQFYRQQPVRISTPAM